MVAAINDNMQGLLHGHAPLPTQSTVICFKPAHCFRASRKRPRSTVSEQHAQSPENMGNPNVQEKLMDIIRVQIGQEKVKDFVNLEREKLRQAAEEVRE